MKLTKAAPLDYTILMTRILKVTRYHVACPVASINIRLSGHNL